MRVSALALFALAAACSRGNERAVADPLAPATSVATFDAGAAPPSSAAAEAPVVVMETAREEIDARFVDDLKKVAADHRAWGRVDDETRWAPGLCRMPLPGRAAMSQANGGGHARKLYSLFAKDRAAYLGASPNSAGAPGQAIVKESYLPTLVSEAEWHARGRAAPEGVTGGGNFDPYARDGDKIYLASKIVGLYVMLKKAPGTPGTDGGWIYGTLTPEGEVTAAGRVASCMGCHATSKNDRVLR